MMKNDLENNPFFLAVRFVRAIDRSTGQAEEVDALHNL